MKKYILYTLTTLSSLWIIDHFVGSIVISGSIWILLGIVLFIMLGIVLVEFLMEKMGNKNLFLFLLIGTFINFFVLYIGDLLIDSLSIRAQSLSRIGLGFLPGDQIVTLLITSLIIMTIATITKWAVDE